MSYNKDDAILLHEVFQLQEQGATDEYHLFYRLQISKWDEKKPWTLPSPLEFEIGFVRQSASFCFSFIITLNREKKRKEQNRTEVVVKIDKGIDKEIEIVIEIEKKIKMEIELEKEIIR